MQYINWQSGVKIQEDGAEAPYTPEDYLVLPEVNETYRFTAPLPAEMDDGNLLFETTGLELTVTLNGEEIWRSAVKAPEGAFNQTQAVIPLPEGAGGELEMICTVLDNTALVFPPLPRFVPMGITEAENYAYANLYGIPLGAAALVTLLVAGLFLLGVLRRRIDWSLIPLFIAAVGLTVRRISLSLGYHFLSVSAVRILSGRAVGLSTLVMLLVYLAMNRRRDIWRYFGLAVAGSAVTLAAGYLVSLAVNGYLSTYLHSQVATLVEAGYYDSLLYWFTIWLTMVCAVISAYVVMRSFALQQAEAQTLHLKNQLILDSYHAIKEKMRDSAALRHEMKHRVTAMDALYQKGDYSALGGILQEMKQQSDKIPQTQFTDNFTINAILQDAVSRAARADIAFDAVVHVPAELTIPEKDLCELLMNMLDNAIEAAGDVAGPAERFIRFHAKVKNGFLAVKCENAFSGGWTITAGCSPSRRTRRPTGSD